MRRIQSNLTLKLVLFCSLLALLPALLISMLTVDSVQQGISATTLQARYAVILPILTAAVVILSYLLARAVTRQLDEVEQTVRRVEQGDSGARAAIITRDQTGRLAAAVNQLLVRHEEAESARLERDALRQSIMRLVDDVSRVAAGDLTVQAEVSADVTADVAHSLNQMITRLRTLILQLQETTLHVSSAANEIQATAEHLAQGSETQAEQILDTSAAVDEMATSIQQVSANSTRSAVISKQALASAEQGTIKVNNSIEGMARIRQQVQETAKRIKRLGESSQEISEIVDLIRSIAKRTSILALNASIQATRAGEAGRSFAVVAEEVERLAERAGEASLQIAQLTNSIQTGISAAVASMETTTQEVVQGTQRNNEVALALEEIQQVAGQLADVIQMMTQAAQQQARGSETIARSMNEIAEITQQTASGSKEASVSISNLAQLADELRQSLGRFRVGNVPAAAD